MPRSAKDIQLIELKDTISKLNELIFSQARSMDSLQKTIEDLRQELANKQAEVDYLKAKLFGSSGEKQKVPFPGQMNLFEAELPDDRIPEIIEPEIVDVAAHKRERKPRATYEEMFDSLPRREVFRYAGGRGKGLPCLWNPDGTHRNRDRPDRACLSPGVSGARRLCCDHLWMSCLQRFAGTAVYQRADSGASGASQLCVIRSGCPCHVCEIYQCPALLPAGEGL